LPSPKPQTTTQLRTLAKFVRDQKRAACPVCKLPVVIRGQLAQASAKKIGLDLQIAWLKTECKADITRDALLTHRSARHDDEQD